MKIKKNSVRSFYNRVGVVRITKTLIDDLHYGDAIKIFKNIIILHAENNFATDEIIYHAISKEFDIVNSGKSPYEYHIQITRNKKQNISKVEYVK